MATHSRVLGWRIPWTEEPGGLQSMGSQRVGHDQGTNTFTFSYQIYKSIKISKKQRCQVKKVSIDSRVGAPFISLYIPFPSRGYQCLNSLFIISICVFFISLHKYMNSETIF